jgi:hypothetical protein
MIGFRVLAAIPASLLSIYLLLVVRHQVLDGPDALGVILGSFAASFAALCWWYVVFGGKTDSLARLRVTMLGGVILGGISFAGGFFGPMILSPNSNQGPLLGISITGPIGFVVGCVAGFLWSLRIRDSGNP